MKYRRLTKEQFEELHKEFVNFLAAQSITAIEWENLKLKKPDLVDAQLDVFSDLVWEGVLEKVNYLENIMPRHLYLFHIKKDSIVLIGLKVHIDSVDLTSKIGFSWLRDNLMSKHVEFFDAEKKIKGDKKISIFELIEKGAQITKGELFKYFEQLIG